MGTSTQEQNNTQISKINIMSTTGRKNNRKLRENSSMMRRRERKKRLHDKTLGYHIENREIMKSEMDEGKDKG